MKLLTKINQFYFIFLLFLFPVMIAVDYYLIQYFVNSEVNDILTHESERIQFHIEKEGQLPHSNYIIEVSPAQEPVDFSKRLTDTLIFDASANELIPYRKYEFTTLAGTEKLKIALTHVLLEMNELILWLFAATAVILILLATGLFFINQKISKWAWKPFYNNLSKLKFYDITKKNPVQLEVSRISEFEELNKVVISLMDQVKKDFHNLKEFNENISHEMQTPLAIVRNKMLLLLESPNLNEKEMQSVQSAYEEVNKLSKIGKSLILISKIENQEFKRVSDVELHKLIDNIIGNMFEIINFKELEMTAELNPAVIKCDPILANILFTNLIKNAIQHNQEGGYIRMLLNEKKFEIENSGEILKSGTAQLFNRFEKGSTQKDTLGLGLAINQKICELYGFKLDYEHVEGKHTFILSFNESF